MKKIIILTIALILVFIAGKTEACAAPADFTENEPVALIFDDVTPTDVISDNSVVIISGKKANMDDVVGFSGLYGRVMSVEAANGTDLVNVDNEYGTYYVSALKLFGSEDSVSVTVNVNSEGSDKVKKYNVRCVKLGADNVILDDWKVNISGSYTFTGNPIVPNVSVVKDSETLGSDKYSVRCLNNVDAGTATVYVSGTGSVDETATGTGVIGLISETFTIAKCPITVTITGNTGDYKYSGEEKSVEGYDIRSSDNNLYPVVRYGNSSTSVYYTFSGSASASGTNAGEYNMSLSKSQFVNHNENFDVNFVINDGKLTINKKKLSNVKMENRTFDYTKDYNPSYRPNNVPADCMVLYGTSEDTINSQSSRMFTDAGAHKIYFKVSDKNYEEASGSAIITIKPLTAEIEWPSSYVDGKGVTPVVKNLISGDRCDVTVTETKGTSSVVCKITALSNNNYKLPTTNLTRTYELTASTSANGNSGTGTSKSSVSNDKTSNSTATTGASAKSSSAKSSSSSSSSKNAASDSSKSSTSDSSSKNSSSDGSSKTVGLSGSTGGDDPLNIYKSSSDDLTEAEEETIVEEIVEEAKDTDKVRADRDEEEAEEEEAYEEESFYDEESYSVDNGVYDSEKDMTYGRAVHLASPDRFSVIYVIVIISVILCIIAAIVFMIINIKKEKEALDNL